MTSFVASPLKLCDYGQCKEGNGKSDQLTISELPFPWAWPSQTPEFCCNASPGNSVPFPTYLPIRADCVKAVVIQLTLDTT